MKEKYKPHIIVNPAYNPIQSVDREYNKQVSVYIRDISPSVIEEDMLNVYVNNTEPSVFCPPIEDIKERTDLDLILTAHLDLLENSKCKSVLFPYGTCWTKNIVEEKTFGVSFLITSPTGLDGYDMRHELWNLKDKINMPINFYNSSRRPSPDAIEAESIGTEFNDKEKLFDNMFSIAIENTKEPYYFSEKLIDCLQSKTVPIYYGCSRLEEFFNMDGVIVVNSAKEIVDVCNSLTPEDYEKMKPAIEENYEKSCYYAEPFQKRLFDTIEKELGLESTIGINKNTKVSICIPTHEMNGMGKEFLENSLTCINQQTYSNIEVIISDQSTNDDIKDVCDKWKEDLDINYLYCDGKRTSTVNTNNAIKHATGDIIKVLFVDDFLLVADSIERVVEEFEKEPDKMWLITSCLHFNQEEQSLCCPMTPRYHDEIYKGNNTISSPSVLSIRNTPELIYIDEELMWLMDVEYYKRLHDKFGPPIVVEHPCVAIRLHNTSVSSEMDSAEGQKVKDEELKYVIEKIEGVTT